MKQLICIDDSAAGLTEGKVYPLAQHFGNGVVQVVNDDGKWLAYYESRFKYVTTPRHKHADVIHAYAEGVEIQWRKDDTYGWGELLTLPNFNPQYDYRVKPAIDTTIVNELESQLVELDEQRLEIEAELKTARGLS